MSISRVEKVQREIIQRYDHISNLYVAYMNSGKYSDEFGREFFHAVGEILQGKPVRQLTLFHLSTETIEEIVNHLVPKGGTAGPKKRRRPKSQRPRRPRSTSSKTKKNVR